ncbi:MAG TPA: DUF58 domain-containing protein [Actinomycetota bacterium]
MLTRRGLSVLAAGALLWVAARLTGSPDLHMVALGLLLLPALAAVFIRWSRHGLRATRRLGQRRVFAGSPLRVAIEVQNTSRSAASLVLLEDRLPPSLGRAARAVLGGLRGRHRQTISYTVHCGRRGRFHIGPLIASVTDPFGLAQRKEEFPDVHELIVYPHVDDLRAPSPARTAGGAGDTTARQLYQSGEEFFTMRGYEIGDDLRRIHWPSTARTGRLMIRQDEAGRRASATVFLDTRRAVYGADQDLERAVSAAASVGTLYLRGGIDLRLGIIDLAPQRMAPEAFLEALALADPSGERQLGRSLVPLRDRSATGSALLFVTGLLADEDLGALIAATGAYGQKVAVLVVAGDGEGVRAARVRLSRAEWRTVLLTPDRRLQEAWTLGTARPIAAAARS